jgi:prepilin-type N-terminal cleavage/methylation domain-containing protein
MRLADHGRRILACRLAFTLIELLVVMAIAAVLVTLLVAAAVRTMGVMTGRATDSTLSKVASELEKQWKTLVAQANREQIPANVITLAGGDERRARVMWIKLRLKQEFPTTYAEARNPTLLQAKNVFKNLPASANDPSTESSALLLLSLSTGRGGVNWDAGNTLGAGAIRDTDGDGFPEIVDTWGKAIYFVRYPIPGANPNLTSNSNPLWVTELNPGGLSSGNRNDSQDPDGLLSSPNWAGTQNSSIFAGVLGQGYTIAPNMSYSNLNPFVGSAGPNGVIGDTDDRFSYNLKKQGAGGDQ